MIPLIVVVFSFDTYPLHKNPATGHSKIFKQKQKKEVSQQRPMKIQMDDCCFPPPRKRPIINSLCKTNPLRHFSLSAEQQGLTILGTGSWRVFWFDRIFYSMIFCQAMGKIRHGGGCRTVPFLEVVWHGWVFGRPPKAKKISTLAFLIFCGW